MPNDADASITFLDVTEIRPNRVSANVLHVLKKPDAQND